MIVDVHKYLFVGSSQDRDLFFKRAQEMGFIEFIPATKRNVGDYPDPVLKIMKAIKILKKEAVVKQIRFVKDRTPEEVVERILMIKEEMTALLDQKKMLKAESARIAPYGDFSIDEIRELEEVSGYHFQFLAVKHGREVPSSGMIFIKTAYDMDYYLSISHELMTNHKMIELHFSRSASELMTDLRAVRIQLNSLFIEMKEMAAYLDFLQRHFMDVLNEHHLMFAKEHVSFPMGDQFFSVEGWVSTDRIEELKVVTRHLGVYFDRIGLDIHDVTPTQLVNENWGSIGEDLVHIYDTPATTDKDPSYWVLSAFALFFAMIVGDAGYGLIYLAVALICLVKFKNGAPALKRFLKLFTFLASACVIWGVMTSSYFGIDLRADHPLRDISLIQYLAVEKGDYHLKMKDDVYDTWIEKYPEIKGMKSGTELLKTNEIRAEFYDNILMELSLIVGIIHIILSLCRYMRRNLSGFGWIAFMVGGYLFFPYMLNATSLANVFGWISKADAEVVGLQLMIGGGVIACMTALFQKRWRGLEEITKLIQIFADTLSYLRLYALGLAGMILAATFNHMDQIVGYAIGFFVMLIGHGINIVLGIMGGTIHGLRLNFLEWYHYSFDGGGKLFRPLKQISRSES
ncbi:MAG: V-type ATP synthase subunit I [Simkaniaceae bacterium]|nr:V-type ATP synthase subunit I [Simkaniaceae bacterium]